MGLLPETDTGTAIAPYLLQARNPDDQVILIMFKMTVNFLLCSHGCIYKINPIENSHKCSKIKT